METELYYAIQSLITIIERTDFTRELSVTLGMGNTMLAFVLIVAALALGLGFLLGRECFNMGVGKMIVKIVLRENGVYEIYNKFDDQMIALHTAPEDVLRWLSKRALITVKFEEEGKENVSM